MGIFRKAAEKVKDALDKPDRIVREEIDSKRKAGKEGRN